MVKTFVGHVCVVARDYRLGGMSDVASTLDMLVGAPVTQRSPINRPFIRGRTRSDITMAKLHKIVAGAHDGKLSLKMRAWKNGASKWPTTIIVAHAGPSSARTSAHSISQCAQ